MILLDNGWSETSRERQRQESGDLWGGNGPSPGSDAEPSTSEGQVMRFAYWSREIAGWVLVLGGLYAFVVAYDLLLSKRIFEAAPMVFIGFIVFRGGIHILKVAVAAQAARTFPRRPSPRLAAFRGHPRDQSDRPPPTRSCPDAGPSRAGDEDSACPRTSLPACGRSSSTRSARCSSPNPPAAEVYAEAARDAAWSSRFRRFAPAFLPRIERRKNSTESPVG